MKQGCVRDDSSSVSQKLPCLSQKPMTHHRSHKNLSLLPILSPTSLFHTRAQYSFMSHFNIISINPYSF